MDNNDWQALTTGAWSYYDHNEANNSIYGKLYNKYSTLGDSLCPKDWHVPTIDEWKTLVDYLGGENVAGGKLKVIGINYWIGPNQDASNVSGFSALPGGARSSVGYFFSQYNEGYFSTLLFENINVLPLSYLYNIYKVSANTSFGVSFNVSAPPLSFGSSVRCMKD